LNVNENDEPGVMFPLFHTFVLLAEVCVVPAVVLFHRTVEPWLIVTVCALKAKFTMLTVTVVGVAGGHVGDGVGVTVKVGVLVLVKLCVGVAEGVLVGTPVGTLVAVLVRVGVGVSVAVSVLVAVGVEVGAAAITWNCPIILSSSCSSKWQWNTYVPV
jgi:hypothetical protein